MHARPWRVWSAVFLGLATFPVWTGTSSAADIVCNTQPTGVTFPGNLVVPTGAVCRITNSTVQGSVTVQPGSSFEAFSSKIAGTVYATDTSARLWDSDVTNSVVMVRPTNLFPNITAALVRNTKVGGSVSVQQTTAPTNVVLGCGGCGTNIIGGNLVVTQNVLPEPFRIFVIGNVVKGSLVCTGNSPVPLNFDNVVSGAKVGQCTAP